jgi:very-short-patch-repair endonuclease
LARRRLTPVARKLRENSTDAERMLWARLRGRRLEGHKFNRQFGIGNAVADFACRSSKLVVEVDGGQHADSLTDAERAKIIEGFGYRIIRFWNHDIIENMDGVLTEILSALKLARGE